MLREALAESLHLRDAAVLDAGAVGELAELVLAVHVVDEVVAELLGRHLGVRHVLGDLGAVRGDHRLAGGEALVDLVLGGQVLLDWLWNGLQSLILYHIDLFPTATC